MTRHLYPDSPKVRLHGDPGSDPVGGDSRSCCNNYHQHYRYHGELTVTSPGSSILIVPKYDYVVTLEVTQLDLKLDMVVSVTMTVRSLKARLQREKGFPVDRTDLLFRDEPMENQRHLFDYHVTHGAIIFIMLHLVYDIRITVSSLLKCLVLTLFKWVLIVFCVFFIIFFIKGEKKKLLV